MRKKFNLLITALLISFTSTYVYANEAENLANFIIRNHDSQLLPVVGNVDAKVTIVEFFDYRCGYCSKQANDFQKLLLETDNAKIIYLEWPIFGGISETAARIALNIWKSNPNLYFEVHNEFMKLGTSIKESNIVNLLNSLNLNGQLIFDNAHKEKNNKIIDENNKLAQSLGLRGTPASIINNSIYPGYVKYETLLELVE